jgi:hypothetical protein
MIIAFEFILFNCTCAHTFHDNEMIFWRVLTINVLYCPYADFSGFPHSLLLQKAVVYSAWMFLRNTGPYSSLETAQRNPTQEIRITWLHPQAIRASQAGPPPTPSSTCSTPWQDADGDQTWWKLHFGLYLEVRGHRWMWRPFLALLRVCTRSGSRDTDPRIIFACLSSQARE